MGGWPKDPEAKKVIRVLKKEFGWQYDTRTIGKSAHGTGFLLCGAGCKHTVNGTASNTARFLWGRARKCPHGRAPDKRHW